MSERRRRRRGRGRRGPRAVYLLPNVLTSGALLAGFWAIVLAAHHEFERSALMIIVAGVLDMLDGRVARATHSTSRFGVEYDSLSDVIAFGVAPALLVYFWALEPLGNRGWLIAALFTLCAALRLARFNVQTERVERRHYQGVPSTIAGGFVASAVLFMGWLGVSPPFPRPLGLAITSGFAVVALLMVSSIPYPSWKSLPPPGRHAYTTLVAVVLAGVTLLLQYEWMLFALGAIFMLSGPWLYVHERRRPPQIETPVEEGRHDV